MSQMPFTGPGQDPMRMSSNQINDMMRLFRGRIGQQTGQMQGAPNSQYEGRNSDGSIFRSHFPMGNNPPVPRAQPALADRLRSQGPESMPLVQTGPQQPRDGRLGMML